MFTMTPSPLENEKMTMGINIYLLGNFTEKSISHWITLFIFKSTLRVSRSDRIWLWGRLRSHRIRIAHFQMWNWWKYSQSSDMSRGEDVISSSRLRLLDKWVKIYFITNEIWYEFWIKLESRCLPIFEPDRKKILLTLFFYVISYTPKPM